MAPFRDPSHLRLSSLPAAVAHPVSGLGRSHQPPEQPRLPPVRQCPLRRLLDQLIDYHRIDDNILYGSLEAIAITASDYDDGLSTTFFQGRAEHQPWERARRRGLRTLLTSDHLLASAALPFVFPATPIGDRFYGDGSIHQLSPLSPAIHLGAERILLVTLDSPHQGARPRTRAA